MTTNKVKQFKKYSRWLPAVLWMSFIFYLSSQTGQPRFPWLATVAHIVEYSVLTALYLYALAQPLPEKQDHEEKRQGRQHSFLNGLGKMALTAFLLSTFYGLTDEVHQYFVPGRFADPMDLLVDSLAALVVSVTFFIRGSRHQVKK